MHKASLSYRTNKIKAKRYDLVGRVVAGDSAWNKTGTRRNIPLEVTITRGPGGMIEHGTDIPDRYGPVLAIVDLEIRRISVQGIAQHEILHNGQRRREDPPGQKLPVRILHIDLHEIDAGIPGDVVDGFDELLRRAAAAFVAGRWVRSRFRVGCHDCFRGAPGFFETGRKDASVGALIVAPVADGVYEHIGGCSGSAPEVG